MKRSLIKSIPIGIAFGLAANQLVCFLASKALRLGYYASCPAWLPEKVGGELNAVLLQMVLFALIGVCISFLVFNMRSLRVFANQRWLAVLNYNRHPGKKSNC